MGKRRIYQIRKLLAEEINERWDKAASSGDYDDEIGTMGILVSCRVLLDRHASLKYRTGWAKLADIEPESNDYDDEYMGKGE